MVLEVLGIQTAEVRSSLWQVHGTSAGDVYLQSAPSFFDAFDPSPFRDLRAEELSLAGLKTSPGSRTLAFERKSADERGALGQTS